MNNSEIIHSFNNLNSFERLDGYRAPHKALLLLLVLGRLVNLNSSKCTFLEIEPDLRLLLRNFGPPGAEGRANQPFWHLQSSPLWRLSGTEHINHKLERTATFSELRENTVSGAIPSEIEEFLRRDSNLLSECTQILLEKNFPRSYDRDVREACGLPLSQLYFDSNHASEARSRDSKFRIRVLSAYKFRCCFCGYKLMLDGECVGLEAAHIRWFSAGGPDTVDNGLALCSLHHTLFDRGALSISDDLKIVPSQLLHSDASDSSITDLDGKPLSVMPLNLDDYPKLEYLQWHRKQVFHAVP